MKQKNTTVRLSILLVACFATVLVVAETSVNTFAQAPLARMLVAIDVYHEYLPYRTRNVSPVLTYKAIPTRLEHAALADNSLAKALLDSNDKPRDPFDLPEDKKWACTPKSVTKHVVGS